MSEQGDKIFCYHENDVRIQFMKPAGLQSRLDKFPAAFFPIGSIEWHNEHLPLGTDTFHAMELSLRLCEQTGGIVLPAFWWNTGGCHRSPSTYYMPEVNYRHILKSVCAGFAEMPIKLLILVNGHGGDYQKESMSVIAGELNALELPFKTITADPYYLAQESPVKIDHADTGETSFSMELIPNLVNMDADIQPDIFSKKKPFADGPPSKSGGEILWQHYLRDALECIRKEMSRFGY